jgi:hypothetical protein
VNPASFNSAARRLDESVVDAHSRHFDFQTFDAQLLHDFLLEGLARTAQSRARSSVSSPEKWSGPCT